MRQLLSGVALATLLAAALPAVAQTVAADQRSARAADQDQGAAATKPAGHKMHHGATTKGSAEDSMADALNRQELDRINQEQTAATPSPPPAPQQR